MWKRYWLSYSDVADTKAAGVLIVHGSTNCLSENERVSTLIGRFGKEYGLLI